MPDNRRAAFHDIARNREAAAPYLVSAWQHLVGHEYGAREFAQATIDFVHRWDWEWVKINPRAIYYAEAWGSLYDRDRYDGFVIPRKVASAITTPEDLEKIDRLAPQGNPAFAEQLAAARLIRNALEDRAVITTVFSPLSVLLQLADLPLYPGDEYARPVVDRRSLFVDNPVAVKRALDNIAHTLADYAAELVRPSTRGGVGLDGVFYAVTGTASADYFTRSEYEEFAAPYDRIVVDAIVTANPEAEILLHTCRDHSHPEWFVDSGASILQWDQHKDGNPQVDVDWPVVPVGGPSSEDFAPGADVSVLRDAIDHDVAVRRGRPFLLAPSCTIPTPAEDAALEVLSDARFRN